MSIQRVDARFVLPLAVERAVVLGGLHQWLDGLKEAGIEVSESASSEDVPEVTVAPVELAADAISTRAGTIVLEGRRGARSLHRAGYNVQTLLPVPSIAEARHLVRPDHPHAAIYAIEHMSVATTLKRRLRNSVAKALLSRAWFPDVLPGFTVGLRTDEPPFHLAAAEEFGVPPGAEWFMTLGGFDALSRSVFQLFAPGESEPGWVVKFTRVPEYTLPFERDERGFRLVQSAGKEVGEHVPRILGQFQVSGLHASVEVAASGYRLTDFLLRDISRDDKLGVIDSVAAWILELGRRTAQSPTTLRGERERLAKEVVPDWAEHGISPDFVEQIPELPSVLQHANLGAWNVIARSAREFAVIDWESVREQDFPLWDLIFFLRDALFHLDEASDRSAHTARLFRGELPSSEALFRWVRRAVEVFEMPPDSVGPVTTLCWLNYGSAVASRETQRIALAAGEPSGETDAERLARLWVSEPGLGPSWDSWRSR
jgi:hypothetical protein